MCCRGTFIRSFRGMGFAETCLGGCLVVSVNGLLLVARMRRSVRHERVSTCDSGSRWNSSIDFCSAARYIELRCTSTAKSTRWASNSGPSTQANSLLPSTSTRQPPHMPVPSIMIGFRLTMVRMCSFRVISATALIMGMGPMASTRSMRVPFSINCRSLSVTKPLSA